MESTSNKSSVSFGGYETFKYFLKLQVAFYCRVTITLICDVFLKQFMQTEVEEARFSLKRDIGRKSRVVVYTDSVPTIVFEKFQFALLVTTHKCGKRFRHWQICKISWSHNKL